MHRSCRVESSCMFYVIFVWHPSSSASGKVFYSLTAERQRHRKEIWHWTLEDVANQQVGFLTWEQSLPRHQQLIAWRDAAKNKMSWAQQKNWPRESQLYLGCVLNSTNVCVLTDVYMRFKCKSSWISISTNSVNWTWQLQAAHTGHWYIM